MRQLFFPGGGFFGACLTLFYCVLGPGFFRGGFTRVGGDRRGRRENNPQGGGLHTGFNSINKNGLENSPFFCGRKGKKNGEKKGAGTIQTLLGRDFPQTVPPRTKTPQKTPVREKAQGGGEGGYNVGGAPTIDFRLCFDILNLILFSVGF